MTTARSTDADANAAGAASRLERMHSLEIGALIGFAFVLPMLEAPKNLLWLAYAALWIANRWRARDFGGPWSGWDSLVAAWIASGYVVAAFAGLHHKEWDGANDILRYGSMLWMIMRAGYPLPVLGRLLLALFAGTALTMAWGAWGVLEGKRQLLGLRSVGHVNHSAIFLAIVFGTALTWVRAAWGTATFAHRVAGTGLCTLFGAGLIVMQSRASVGAAFVAALVVLAAHALRSRLGLRKVIVGSLALVALLLLVRPNVIEKNDALLRQDMFLAYRDAIWRAGIEAWRAAPVFGVGMSNYGRIGYEQLEAWSAARGQAFDRNSVALSSHGHSLYVNTLAERGLVGLGVLLAVLGAWFWSLARALPSATAPPLVWAYWGGAAFAWLVAVIVGFANTTLHSEHALVSMLLLGGWLSISRARTR